MMLRARSRAAGLVVALTVAFGAGYGVHAWTAPSAMPAAAQAAPEARYPGFNVFWEAWDLVQRNYVQPQQADPHALTYGAIEGMLGRLGDEGHTRFLSPEERKRWNESLAGNFVGIGIHVTQRDGRPLVVAPIPNSPAAEAGMKSGDVIMAIGERDTAGLTLEELGTALRGPEGSKVQVTIRHAGEAVDQVIEVERRRIDLPSVSWTMLPGAPVALVRISQFADGAHEQLLEALKAARAAGAKGIVLDLRDNPGGLLEEAIGGASEFLSGGTIVQVQARDGSRTPEADRDGAGGAATDLPLVALINEGSASSAEILAGALKENGRAPLIGVKTFGTGTVLSTYELSDGSAVLLGTSLWLTPEGHLIKGQGVAPTTPLALPPGATPLLPEEAGALTPDALRATQDTQLLRALDDVAAQIK
jgi:carboxyl-terminal processing protease